MQQRWQQHGGAAAVAARGMGSYSSDRGSSINAAKPTRPTVLTKDDFDQFDGVCICSIFR